MRALLAFRLLRPQPQTLVMVMTRQEAALPNLADAHRPL